MRGLNTSLRPVPCGAHFRPSRPARAIVGAPQQEAFLKGTVAAMGAGCRAVNGQKKPSDALDDRALRAR